MTRIQTIVVAGMCLAAISPVWGQSSPLDATYTPDSLASDEAMLRAGIENNVYLVVDLVNRRGVYTWCETQRAFQTSAKFTVLGASGTKAFITKVPARVSEHDAMFSTAAELALHPARGRSLQDWPRCYIVDMTDMPNSPTASQIIKTARGMGLLLGRIAVSDIVPISGPAVRGHKRQPQSRYYRIEYRVARASVSMKPIPSIDNAAFLSTCTLIFNNAKNGWVFNKCTSDN